MSNMSTDVIKAARPQQKAVRWPSDGAHVVRVLCGGVACTERTRAQLLAMDSAFITSLFGPRSLFLGSSVVPWTGSCWEWAVLDSTAADAEHVRRVLSLCCPRRADAADRLRAAPERTRDIAQLWGLM